MPPIMLHMVLAHRIADDLGSPLLAGHFGAYTLGSTSPDIRVLTREPRSRTHFFDLDEMQHQDSVGAFFAAQGNLALHDALNEDTRAWVAGYVTHLSMDEAYITTVYRKVFARYDELGGRLRANAMDRLLQFDLDREYGSDRAVSGRIVEALAGTVAGIESGFLDQDLLDRWRGVCSEIASRGMDWAVMRRMMTNHLRHSGIRSDAEMNEFLDRLPELREDTRAHITDDEIAAFVERAVDTARRQVEEYLR